MPVASELNIDTTATALAMADSMFGAGITVVNASYTGAAAASGIYTDGIATAPGLVPADQGVILSTGQAADITNTTGDANVAANTTTNWNGAGDADLTAIAGVPTFDASIFQANFIPEGSFLTMQVTFASEEYLEYVNGGFNDAVGIFVNGTKATLDVGNGDISIDNINNVANPGFFVDNPAGSNLVNTEMDGLTVTLTLTAPVNPDVVNTIKFGIADAGDGTYDSNLLIAAESVQTAMIAEDDEGEIFGVLGDTTIDVLGNDSSIAPGTLTITTINGQAVSAGSAVVLPTGETVILNADGTLTIQADGDEATTVFSYQVADSQNNTDTALVTVNTVACFTKGAMVVTQAGLVAIEDLQVGDKVFTRDSGLQPVRWIGQSTRKATGKDAPVVIEENALGEHDRTMVSQNHRVLAVSTQASLLFGENEVLMKAKDMVNGSTIRFLEDGSDVTYVHVLFDQHEIILADGLYSESYHPGQHSIESFDPATRDEVLRLMPCMDPMLGYGYGPAARVSLKKREAQMLAQIGDIRNTVLVPAHVAEMARARSA